MEIKYAEVLQHSDKTLYLNTIETYDYDKSDSLEHPEYVRDMMIDIFQIHKKISEEIYLIALTTKSVPLAVFKIGRGAIDSAMVDIRGIMISLLLSNAAGFILVHNHPSGNCGPSDSDEDVTKKIYKASQLLEINFLDHIIIDSTKSFHSFYTYIQSLKH